MSKDIIVLTPNGRRQKVHCTPDTSILQVLEDVCQKQGFEATSYDLKHHNHILDLTSTIRFSNLPNKAMLEMVEAERKREESVVTIGLLFADGERKTADFLPNTSLYEVIATLAPAEFKCLQQPTILYMRQEVIGESALKEKTLKQLGLIKGRAILRLQNKAEEGKQANVSSVYRKIVPETQPTTSFEERRKPEIVMQPNKSSLNESSPGPSNIKMDDNRPFDPIKVIKNEVLNKTNENIEVHEVVSTIEPLPSDNPPTKADHIEAPNSVSSNLSFNSQKNLERRLNIEEEVTFVGTQKAIAFMQPDEILEEIDDLPDDFYELTIEEVRKLYHDLQKNRLELENTPLITAAKKGEVEMQTSAERLSSYKNVVVRIQFPDQIILQGVFLPSDRIEDVNNFIKSLLKNPEKRFHIFTTPLKENLDPTMTLLEAKFVPCVHMHFKWVDDDGSSDAIYLRDEIYSKKTTSDAASILASKYRAPSRRKMDDAGSSKNAKGTSTSKNSKVPKWFKK